MRAELDRDGSATCFDAKEEKPAGAVDITDRDIMLVDEKPIAS